MHDNEPQKFWLMPLSFAFFVGLMYIISVIFGVDFKKDGILTAGTVYAISSYIDYKLRHTSLEYTYKVKDSLYYGSYRYINSPPEYCTAFGGKTFPLYYSNINPEESTLIVDQSDYKNYGLTMPDSMK